MYVTEVVVSDWQGNTNGKFVKELLLLRQMDLVALMNPVEFPNFFRNLPTSLTFGPGTIFQPGDTISLRSKTLEGYCLPYGVVTVNVDAPVFRIVFAQDSCVFSEGDELIDNGKVFSPTFDLELPRNNPAVARWLSENGDHKMVAFWRDANGMCFVTGDTDCGLTIATGKEIAGKNFYKVQLFGSNKWPSWHIEGIDLEKLFESTEFSIEFEFEFNS